MKKHTLDHLKLGAAPLVLGIALISAPAFAQVSPEPIGDDASSADASTPDQGELIVVTGSRIRSPNLESASPITVISSEEFKQTGTTRVEDLVNSLPQVFADDGAGVSNGASGTATLNLRGLGSERTLVLVNGRRLVPGDPTTSSPDINVIPAALVKRVDVLTGGASAVYGADAVAGVVNFVMDTEFEGFRLDSQYSVYNHNNRGNSDYTDALDARNFPYPKNRNTDGGTFDATAVFGAGFDDGRGHVTAYLGYRKVDAVAQAKRDYSSCSLSARSTAQVAANGQPFSCGGSATTPQGSFIVYDSFGDPTDVKGGGADGMSPDGVADALTSTIYSAGPNRTFLNSFAPYNFAPLNYFQRPDERYTAGAFADYEVSDSLTAYGEFMFMDDRTVAQIAPSGDFGNTLSINCDNPLLSAQQLSIACDNENLLVSNNPSDAFTVVGNVAAENAARIARGQGEPLLQTTPFDFIDSNTGAKYNRGFAQILRRNVEGGPRRDDLQHTSYRGVLGVRGDLSPAWSYDAYYQYGRTNFAETYTNDFSVSRLTRALDVVTGANGQPVCRSTIDGTDPNCVPYDIFTPGGVSQAAVGYLATPGFQRGIVSEQVASAYLSGSLGEYGIKSPFSDEGIGIVVGAEYRKERLEFLSDIAFQTGDLAGQGAPTLPVNGQFDVKEVFTEVSIPLVTNSWLYDARITGGYRYSDYSTGNQTDTYKIEGELAPTPDIRFRGGYNRAVRAPTLQDLFAPQRVALNGNTDPCAGTADNPKGPLTSADAGCLAQGLAIGQSVTPNPAGQYNGLIGGNPNLVPEKADTYTAGVVLTPTFFPGFTASVDYFKIDLTGAIQGIGQDTILQVCTDTADPFFCSLINRDGSGSIWRTPNGFVQDLSQNIGGLSTSGIDVVANYNREIGAIGRLGLSFVGTYLIDLTTKTGIENASDFDCAGYYGSVCSSGNPTGSTNPEWRHQARLSFDLPSGIGASLRWRYFGGSDQDTTNPDIGGTSQPGNAHIDPVSYFDLALTARVGDNYNFRLGANNLLDKEPPLVGSQSCPAGPCNGNTYATVYDAIGRYFYAGVTLDF